jgi:RNA 2',3'-cyclic 3'-phosphodiesterase
VIRLFVALDLPEDVRAALAAVGLGEGWRPVRPEGLHVTLAFLGWREPSDVPAVASAVSGAIRPADPLSIGEAVLLPPRRPRVMAVSLSDPSGASVALQASVSGALAAAGLYEPEQRAWLPHVTIGRARGRVGRRGPVPTVPAASFRPPSVSLYRSVLGAGGARYEALERYPL